MTITKTTSYQVRYAGHFVEYDVAVPSKFTAAEVRQLIATELRVKPDFAAALWYETYIDELRHTATEKRLDGDSYYHVTVKEPYTD